uniref:Fibronectin type-III domain-containing protein n=1 Tax=Haptolina ericina TaxID=156174 RepID=A0A7S3EXL1_9EUKA
MGVVEWTQIQPQPPEIGLDAPTRLTVTGLEPETRYRFRVRACMETAKSPWTKTALPVLTDKHIEKESPSPKRKAKVASPHTARARKRAAAAPAPAAGPSTAGPSDGGLQSVKAMLQAAGLSYAALEEVSQKLRDNGFSHLETLKALEANGNLKDIMREIGIKLGHYCQMALALK